MSTWIGWRGELWWRAERWSGRIWRWASRDGVTAPGLDWLPAFTFRRRKAAERRYEEQTTRPAPSAEDWSYRARVRQATRMPDTGEMWEYNRARPLDAREYDHWQTHVLPRGWSILRAPAERKQTR